MHLAMLKKSFKINNEIYSDDIILIAIDAFVDVANITYNDWLLNIESEENLDEIFNEFMNYTIWVFNES